MSQTSTSAQLVDTALRYAWPPGSIIYVHVDGDGQSDVSRMDNVSLAQMPARERAVATALLEHSLQRLREAAT